MTQPTQAADRIYSIDVLRGFAVLGILLMNILGFAFPGAPWLYPDGLPGNSGLNRAVWMVTFLAVSGVFRALFTILFGAGALLFISRAAKRSAFEAVADAYFRRNLWLMVLGLLHAFLLLGWIDVLFRYGLLALGLFPFRKLAARRLALLGGILLAVPVALGTYGAVGYHAERAASQRAVVQRSEGAPVSSEDSLLADRWAHRVSDNTVEPGARRTEIETRRSGYLANLKSTIHRFAGGLSNFFSDDFWDEAMMMLFGMALLQWGVLTAQRSRRFFFWMAVCGFGLGLAIKTYQLRVLVAASFDPFSIALQGATYHPGRLLVAFGWIGTVMLACQTDGLAVLTRRLSAVGRMALTNYLLQTLLCVILFYGFGFGLFARLERWQVACVAAAIWTVELLVSPVWLRHFRFGPVEWLWRSLTYLSRQPMRVTSPSLEA